MSTPTLADYLFAWSNGEITNPRDHASCTREFEVQQGHWGVFPGRKPVTDDPWPFTPDNCAYAGYNQGEWTRDGQHLVCIGCGLDCT